MRKATKERFEESRRILKENGNEGTCPIWTGSSAGTVQTGDVADPKRFWSPRAGGVFEIPGGTLMPDMKIPDEETRKKVSSWIWERNAAFEELSAKEDGQMPELTPALIEEIGKRRPLPVETRIDRALRVIGRPPKGLSMSATPVTAAHERFMAATECGDTTEMAWLLDQLAETGLLTSGVGASRYVLSLKGLDRLETGGEAVVSRTAFVAMWFNDEVNDAYDAGIDPAIRDAGYEPVRIDRVQHSDKIDDRIVAEIRRSRFLVCDFTCGVLPTRLPIPANPVWQGVASTTRQGSPTASASR